VKQAVGGDYRNFGRWMSRNEMLAIYREKESEGITNWIARLDESLQESPAKFDEARAQLVADRGNSNAAKVFRCGSASMLGIQLKHHYGHFAKQCLKVAWLREQTSYHMGVSDALSSIYLKSHVAVM
jgi:hypothetical protein